MKKILTLAWNVIRVEFSEPSALVFTLLLPILFTIVIGVSMGGNGSAEADQDNRLPVFWADQDQTAISADFKTSLEASDVIRLVEKDETEARALLDDGEGAALLVIPAGFGAALDAGQGARARVYWGGGLSAQAADQAIQSAASRFGSAISAAQVSVAEHEKTQPFASEAERQAYAAQALQVARVMVDQPSIRTTVTYSPNTRVEANGFQQSSAGQLVTWVLVTLLSGAGTFVYERETGALRRLMTTPTSKLTLLVGKITGWMAIGLTQMLLLVGFGALVLKVEWGRSPLALAVMLVSFAFSVVTLGLLLASFVKTHGQAGSLRTMLAMSLAALGGAWWPMEVTPALYQTLVKALPTTWAMRGLTDVIVRGSGVMEVLPYAGILMLFSVVFLVLGARRLRFD